MQGTNKAIDNATNLSWVDGIIISSDPDIHKKCFISIEPQATVTGALIINVLWEMRFWLL